MSRRTTAPRGRAPRRLPRPRPDDKSGGEGAAGGELSGGAETAEDARPSPTPNDCDMLVPESEAVDDSYFDDAVFIGNSRTEGLKMYSGLSNATFITEVGLTVDSIFTDYCNISGGGKARAFDQLASMEFGKVYIMLGMNELGWVYESVFKEDYGEKEVWYVDVAAGVMDEDGYLPYEATGDGVHLTPEYCVKWMDYLRTHTAQ